MKLVVLVSDIWQLILPNLEEKHIHKLRCSGDRFLRYEVLKLKSAHYDVRLLPRVCRPPSVSSESRLENLSISVEESMMGANRIKYKNFMSMDWMPRTLRRLKLVIDTDNLPFVLHSMGSFSQLREQFDDCVPNLEHLTLYLRATGGYWALPKSVTFFDGKGAAFPFGCFPPHLRHIVMAHVPSTDVFTSLPKTIESMASNSGPDFAKIYLNNLPALPALTSFSGSLDVSQGTNIAQYFPMLTYLKLDMYQEMNFNSLPPLLTSLHLSYRVPPLAYPLLPRNLTKITYGYNLEREHIHECAVDKIHLLPRSLRYIRIKNALYLSKLPKTLFTLDLPSHLVYLDMSWVARDPKVHSLSLLPPSLTTLHIHNLTADKDSNISHLKLLTTLRLRGGTLTSRIAKSMPRTLLHLYLSRVSLRRAQSPKGSYQTAAFKHIPRFLASFGLSGSEHCYISQLNDILNLVPSTIESLMIGCWATVPEFPLMGDQEERSCFKRFIHLKNLSFWPELDHPESQKWHTAMVKQLPDTLEALYVPNFRKEACQWIPPNVIAFESSYALFRGHSSDCRNIPLNSAKRLKRLPYGYDSYHDPLVE